MNPNLGYQLYQADRTRTRAEILAEDARRGRSAAAVRRGSQTATRTARTRTRAALHFIARRPAHAA
jgi:hypothetical protein